MSPATDKHQVPTHRLKLAELPLSPHSHIKNFYTLHYVYSFILQYRVRRCGKERDPKKAILTYPGSEFVVANTLAKWTNLKPNEIDLSQGFIQKIVSRFFSVFNPLLAGGDFCHLLITFANSLDPYQARQNVGPEMDLHCLTPCWY